MREMMASRARIWISTRQSWGERSTRSRSTPLRHCVWSWPTSANTLGVLLQPQKGSDLPSSTTSSGAFSGDGIPHYAHILFAGFMDAKGTSGNSTATYKNGKGILSSKATSRHTTSLSRIGTTEQGPQRRPSPCCRLTSRLSWISWTAKMPPNISLLQNGCISRLSRQLHSLFGQGELFPLTGLFYLADGWI